MHDLWVDGNARPKTLRHNLFSIFGRTSVTVTFLQEEEEEEIEVRVIVFHVAC